ncbi:MAG TPA: prolyl oligopeptidase family serine peptidase [Verrucomicrobiales bacterium]|nr:prolyl oligopeptidase family serine peptidase [Verrucomicrobiales bacterium]
MKKLALVAFIACCIAPALLSAREWTSTDGRKLQADFVSLSGDTVILRRSSDGREFTLALDRLSESDREWIETRAADRSAAGDEDPPATKPFEGPYAELITGDWRQFEGEGDLQLMFFGAKSLDPAKEYPLVLYLHGKGNDVLSKAHLGFAASCADPKNYAERPCFIVAPQCPDENGWRGEVASNVIDTIEDLSAKLPIDEDRIYLAGYSMGGFGTFQLLVDEPKLFAAGVPIAGGVNVGAARDLRRTPLWVFHGEQDDVVPPDGSRAIVKALERLRAPVRYTEFPGAGHGITGEVNANAELHQWLFDQKRR